MNPEGHASLPERRPDASWLAIGLLIVLAFVLGVIGYVRYYGSQDPSHEVPTLGDLLYYTMGLFSHVWHPSTGEAIPWQLEAARFLAPLSLAAAVIKTALMLLREHVQVFRGGLRSNHAVVCGLGRTGLALVESIERKGTPAIVVIESDDSNPEIETVRARGIPVVKGSARDRRTLRLAGVSRAKYLFALTGDDEVNLEIAVQASSIERAWFPRSTERCRCAIHVRDDNLADLFADTPLILDDSERFCAHLFNLHRFAARTILERYPPDEEDEALHQANGPAARVTIFGDGMLAEEMVLQLARIGHYGSRQRPIVRVIGAGVVDALAARRCVLEEIIELHIVSADTEALLSDELALERVYSGQPGGTTYVCLSDMASTLRLGEALRRIGRTRVCVCLPYRSKLPDRISSLGGPRKFGDHVYDVMLETCTFDNVMQHRLDLGGRVIHDHYVSQQRNSLQTPTSNPSLVAWHELSETLKESNRSQADHIPVKLRAIGRGAAQWSELKLNGDDVELLAEMEHRRWCAEKRLAGWRHAPGDKDPKKRTSPDLVPWDELPEEEKNKNRSAIMNLPELIRIVARTSEDSEER